MSLIFFDLDVSNILPPYHTYCSICLNFIKHYKTILKQDKITRDLVKLDVSTDRRIVQKSTSVQHQGNLFH